MKLFIFAAFLAMAPLVAHAKRDRPKLRRATSQPAAPAAPASASTDGAETGPVVVQLRRVSARHTSKATVAADSTFYVGNISVGTPAQHLEVLFDTASGHILLPHKACHSAACLEHHHYSPWASSSAVDVNNDGKAVQEGVRLANGKVNRSFAHLEFTQSDLGEGSAKGVLVREHVCMSSCAKGRQACTDLAVLAATEEDYTPFGAMPSDGIVGLGLEGLAVGALSSFYPRLLDGSQGMSPEIGLSLGPTGGEIIFGGRSPTAGISAPIEWFPVVSPEQGFWQIEILSVRVGGVVVDDCARGCAGIVDSASSRLGVQKDRLARLQAALATSGPAPSGGCQGPDLQLELRHGFALTLSAADYTGAESARACEAELGSLNLEEPEYSGIYSLGTAVLRSYYAAFDWQRMLVGFAPNAGKGSLRMAAGLKAAPTELLTV